MLATSVWLLAPPPRLSTPQTPIPPITPSLVRRSLPALQRSSAIRLGRAVQVTVPSTPMIATHLPVPRMRRHLPPLTLVTLSTCEAALPNATQRNRSPVPDWRRCGSSSRHLAVVLLTLLDLRPPNARVITFPHGLFLHRGQSKRNRSASYRT